MNTLNGNVNPAVAILLENHFEDSEFQIPYNALKQSNVKITIVGTRINDKYEGKRGKVSIKPDATATEVRSEDFDAIIIPGGSAPDKIRTNPHAVRFVMDAMAQEKLIAAVCHGPQVLIEADQLRGKQATGYEAIRKDMENAGATYIDEPVVVQGNLITARKPSDLPLFTTTILTRLGLSLPDSTLPDTSDRTYEWWKLGEAWGGSTRQEIINALKTAITGESYTRKAFELYGDKITDTQAKTIFKEILFTKQQHIERLKDRLAAFDEDASWQTAGSEAFATLQSWLHSSDDMEIMRRALGDIQTGVIDAQHLCSQLTDPITVALLSEIKSHLSQHEFQLSDLYRSRKGKDVQPPLPTTMAIVG
jgi:protease I